MQSPDGIPRLPWLAVTVLISLGLLLPCDKAQADRLLLRSLDIISNRKVESFDEDGVKLDDGRIFRWDEIEQGMVEASKQDAFDKMLKELGEPLHRLVQRLKVGDFRGLSEHAEAVYPRYIGRSSPTAYMVFQSLMWSRLAEGKREMSVEPYLRAFEYLRSTNPKEPDLPGERRLQFDLQTAMTPELDAVWFDAAAAKESLQGVREAARAMKTPHPEGVFLYYATLAFAAGEIESGLELLNRVKGTQRKTREQKLIATAQHESLSGQVGGNIRRLEEEVEKMLPENRPAAYYWIGLEKTQQTEKQIRMEGVLQLVRIAALFEKQSPELAAAGLYQAMMTLDDLKDLKGSLALRGELQSRYGNSTHARKLSAKSATPKSD